MHPTHPRRRSPLRPAFALTDLLVLLAVVAVAAAVLAPALSASRRAGQNQVAQANLKRLIRAHAAYSLSEQDRWMNPFNPTTSYNGQPNAIDPEWFSVRVPNQPNLFWRFNNSGYQTEMFSLYWSRFIIPYAAPGDWRSPVQFDPRDVRPAQRLAQFPDPLLSSLIWDSSFVYSPTMWFNPSRYSPVAPQTARLNPTAPNQLGGTRSVRYNLASQVAFPSQKAVLFSRFDFDQPTRRNGANQVVALPPQWNNPAARPDVAFADGSADEVTVRKLEQAESQSAATYAWLRPTNPNWNIPSSLLDQFGLLGDGFENGQSGTVAHPARFWGTRDGVLGRDVTPR
ncbi:MAG TPA: hypothetical protein VFF65_04550 [Phycisphaerales bacterium]|nr:hypothetical protein [Phycisphaerales bacterium]